MAMTVFFAMSLVVIWHLFAPDDYKILSENGKKLWAMAGLSLYIVILLERKRRADERDD